jgi:hypothetical protein
MRNMALCFGLMVLFALTAGGCKKGDKPPWAEKKTDKKPVAEAQPEKAAPEKAAQKVAETPEPLEAVAESVPAEASEDQPAAAEEDSPVDEASCNDKIAAEEARIRRDVIPVLREEEEATVEMNRWIKRTFETLDAGNSDLSKEKIARYWEEYEECLKRMKAPQAERDPECVAYVTADESACQRLGTKDMRTRCTDTVQTKTWEKNLYDWAKGGFSADFCTQKQAGAANHQISAELCRVISENGSCSKNSVSSHMVKMCKAAQAGLKGANCGGDFAEGTPYCDWLNLVKSPDRVALCKAAVKDGKLDIYSEDCEMIEQVAGMDCDAASKHAPATKTEEEPNAECLFISGLKSGQNTCAKAGITDPDDCALYMSFVAAVNGTPEVCAALSDERAQMRCRTFLSVDVDDCELKTSKDWGTGAKDDGPCRKLLYEKKVLPAKQGQLELRITVLNPFLEPARCTFVISMTSAAGYSKQTLEVPLAGAETKVLQEFFLAVSDSTFAVDPKCTWERKDPPDPAEAK